MPDNKYTGRHPMRYAVKLPLPRVLRNRPIQHWEERPDLQQELQAWIESIETWCWHNADHNFAVGVDKITAHHMEVHFELELDAVRFNQQQCAGKSTVDFIFRPEYMVSWTN